MFFAALVLSLQFPFQPSLAPDPALASAVADGGKLDFAAMSKSALAAYGLEKAKLSDLGFADVIRKRFFRVQLGAVTLHLPGKENENTDDAKDFLRCASALVKVQREWLRWTANDKGEGGARSGGAGGESPDKDIETVLKWVESWSPNEIQRLDIAKEADLAKALAPNAAQLEALKRTNDFFATGGPLGVRRAGQAPAPLVVMPNRKGFCELIALAGYLDSDLQQYFWLDNLDLWTEGKVDDFRIISLKFAETNGKQGDYSDQIRMDEKDKTAVEQYAAERGALAVLNQAFGDSFPDVMASGLAMNLVIGALGMDNTRSEGDLRGKSVPPIEIFVPGGASEGGTLPAPNLESKWREKKGTDYFIPVLKQNMKSGREKSRNPKKKNLCVLIRGDDNKGSHVVEAPFLGVAAKATKPPPQIFMGDYLEFFRSYKVGFMHWLANESMPQPEEARKRFARIMAASAKAGSADQFEAICAKELGKKSFSSAEVGEDTVEGAFLRWLAK
ncbi:MAG: hypothetical protein EPO68_13135 [Planctomycetota bacterium]|nr:MAG: hypothetical protein EPO68_13135 [Planctomycetota bacterium]